MKKTLLFIVLVLFVFASNSFAQRILLSQDFQTGPWTTDSIPLKWAKFKVNGPGLCTTAPLPDWRVRDSGKAFCATNSTPGFRTKAYMSNRSISIPWTATTGSLTDDWLFTDSVTIATGDSLLFWVQLGTWPDGSSTYYPDSLQVWVSTNQLPTGGTKTYLGRMYSLPQATNTWQQAKYNLSAFNGQRVYIALRYYMNVSVNGIMVNVDDLFIGNRSGSPVSINNNNGLVPDKYDLKQNYPNPFNPVTSISYDLPKREFVNITVYNSIGKEVAVLVNEQKEAGSYSLSFDATSLPSGIYMYRINAGDFQKTMKMSLIK